MRLTEQQREAWLWIERQKRLGVQKIDIVTARAGEARPTDHAARATDLPA